MAQHTIDSLDDPRLAPYRSLKDTNRPRGFDCFIAEGEKLAQRLLDSSCRVHSVLVDRTHLERLKPWLWDDVEVFVVADRLVPQIVGFNFHRGVLACGYRPANVPLHEIAATTDSTSRLAWFLRNPPHPHHLQLVILAGIQDPENLGTIIRTSAALGMDAVLLGGGCADPFSRRVLRTSMGAVWRLPLRLTTDLAGDLYRLREEFDVKLLATVLDPNAAALNQYTPPARYALLLGNEGHGLSESLVALCHQRLTLPMQAGTDSLNVSIAAGIFLYHLTSASL